MSAGNYTRIHVESPGNILTASNYNAEHDNHITNQNPIGTAGYSDDATQSNLTSDPGLSGAETLATSLATELTQLRYAISRIIGGAGWRAVAPISLSNLTNLEVGKVANIGLTLGSGIMTVKGADGTALSTSNPGYITVPSTTAGLSKTLKVTVGGILQDDVASPSYMTNLEFGISAGSDWAQDMPFFLYSANRANSDIDGVNGSSCFFIARNPCLVSTPSSASDIGNNGTIPVNDSQNVILLLNAFTVANYTSLPCQLLGAFRMRYLTSSHDWTIQTFGNTDGIGKQALDRTFATEWTYPLAQNGASAGSFLIANGSTVPIFTTNYYKYTISDNGLCRIDAVLDGDGGTDGSGANNMDLSVPYTIKDSQANVLLGFGQIVAAASSSPSYAFTRSASAFVGLAGYNVSSNNLRDSVSSWLHSNFTNGNRNISMPIQYKAF